MANVQAYKLAEGFRIEVAPPCETPRGLEARVAEIWEREKEQRGDQLTDGRIFSRVDWGEDFLVIQESSYRFALAGLRDSSLFAAGLRVRPLAVTGVLVCRGGVVLGRRGQEVSSDRGLWEPVPAGGLSQESPVAQIYEELAEELGLQEPQVASAEVCGLFENTESRVADIVYRLRAPLDPEEIFASFRSCETAEHSELVVVDPTELPDFLNANSESLLPGLAAMLEAAGLIGKQEPKAGRVTPPSA